MKKVLLILISVFSLFLTFGCSNSSELTKEVKFIDYHDNVFPNESTYKFIGISEHFGMATGKVYYSDTKQGFLLTNFSVIKPINKSDNIEKYHIELSFNGIPMFTNEFTKLNGRKLDDVLSLLSFSEVGTPDKYSHGESDAFLKTKQQNFKSAIQLKIKYCYKNGKCNDEKLKLTYIE